MFLVTLLGYPLYRLKTTDRRLYGSIELAAASAAASVALTDAAKSPAVLLASLIGSVYFFVRATENEEAGKAAEAPRANSILTIENERLRLLADIESLQARRRVAREAFNAGCLKYGFLDDVVLAEKATN